MTNTYGTIPTSTAASSSASTSTNLDFISRAKDRFKSGLATRAPWNLMFDFHSFTLPHNFHDTLRRFKINISYFRMNYAIIVLLILFLSLLWHPIALIVFTAMTAVWLFLYFLRDEPLIVFGSLIDDRVVLVTLSVLTIAFLFFTNAAALNVLISVLIGALVVIVHAVVRKTEDLFLDEDSVSSGLIDSRSLDSF